MKEIRRADNGRARGTGSGVSILDVWVFGSSDFKDTLLDVTHRHPMKSTRQPAAAHEPGCCCRLAANDKASRYPPAGGRSVVASCFESWGRLSEEAEELLCQLSAMVARRDQRHGRDSRGHLSRWRARLDAVTCTAAAAMIKAATVGLQREPHTAGRACKGARV